MLASPSLRCSSCEVVLRTTPAGMSYSDHFGVQAVLHMVPEEEAATAAATATPGEQHQAGLLRPSVGRQQQQGQNRKQVGARGGSSE